MSSALCGCDAGEGYYAPIPKAGWSPAQGNYYGHYFDGRNPRSICWRLVYSGETTAQPPERACKDCTRRLACDQRRRRRIYGSPLVP